jgi:7-keto-8-aminopelargonate synthetase-like enzyme
LIGENGRGTLEHFAVEGKVDMVIGTLSKAFGAIGGFLNGPPEVIKLLKGSASSYVYSSSIPPEQAYGILAALKIIKEQPGLRKKFWENVRHLKQGLNDKGFDTLNSETHIIPIFIGDERRCIKASRMLLEKGILVPAVRSPIVQKGKARIRISPMATHTRQQLDMALDAFCEVGKKLGII